MSLLDLASLVLAPTATKEGKVYSAIPDTGEGDMTFSRGSSATRVNSAGLIEKERANFLLQSNSFDTTWSANVATLTSGQSGYDGTNNAWKLTADSTGTFRRLSQSTNENSVVTSSVYAKAGTADHLYMIPTNMSYSTGGYQFFDLTNGTLGASSFLKIIDASIEDVGGGWYRCTIVSQPDTLGAAYFGLSNNDTDTTITGGNYIYIQDAQLENGLVAQPYIETTTTAVYEGITDDVPRVDYSGGGCPSLLLEGQRTNLYTYSEYSAIWNKTNWTTTDNYAISPEGVKNAFRAVSLNTSGILYLSGSGTTGQDNTLSVWAKSNTGGEQKFRFWGNGNTITSSDFTATTEWQRFDYTYNCAFVTAGIKGASSELSDILFYGFQHEAGSYPTSYIPTYGTSTSRVADSCSKTGISELIGQSEGTLFAEVDVSQLQGAITRIIFSIQTGTTFVRLLFSAVASNTLRALVRNSGVNKFDARTTISTTGIIKLAFAYKSLDSSFYVNGVQITNVLTDLSFGSITMSDVVLGYDGSANQLSDSISQAILFPTRLTNDQLSELTK